ncbi:MAG: 50S ribosomal protein L35 [Candidatus Paceibacterota bacterium]
MTKIGTGRTNKSLAKRLRVTKKGKVMKRKAGHCHFNAKQKRSKQLNDKRQQLLDISKSELGRYLPKN